MMRWMRDLKVSWVALLCFVVFCIVLWRMFPERGDSLFTVIGLAVVMWVGISVRGPGFFFPKGWDKSIKQRRMEEEREERER